VGWVPRPAADAPVGLPGEPTRPLRTDLKVLLVWPKFPPSFSAPTRWPSSGRRADWASGHPSGAPGRAIGLREPGRSDLAGGPHPATEPYVRYSAERVGGLRSPEKIEALIQPHKLVPVKEALKGIGVDGITIFEAHGHGRQKGHTETYRGAEYKIDLLPKIKLELVVPGTELERTVAAIAKASRSGSESFAEGRAGPPRPA